METACLKIKFIPLLKETLKNNSKYYLEIVPEVLNIQNFDKLTWAKEGNFIEYAVPMTHKIILQKQNSDAKSDEIVKMYHSCVDLLQSPSKTNHNIGSGDISKIISDTLIINKQEMSLLKSDDNNCKKLSVNNVTYEIIPSSTSIHSVKLDIINSVTKQKEEDLIHDDLIRINSTNKTCDKAINTDNMFESSKNTEWPAKHSNSRESKRKLSLAPICAINTQELTSSLIDTRLSKTYKKQDFHKPLELVSKRSDDNQLSYILSHFGLSGQSSSKTLHFTTSYRSPPEIRIAQYVHRIQNELLPLNIILNDILKKCSSLDLSQVESSRTNSSSNYLSSFNFEDCNRLTTETCEKVVSNRAVYTIVYNE